MKKLLLLSVSLPSLVAADMAVAQQADEDVITVVGSRVKGRTSLETNVPVDVIQVGELTQTPSLNLKDALQSVSPSFAVERDAIADGNSLIRTSSLRGLNQGEVLTLLNGKRMHRHAIIHTDGWQAADLGSISSNSIKSISVLRDGASAQYGADAVAGVVNVELDDSEGISGTARFGQFYEGDGFNYEIGSKVGISLADRGFLTVTASYGAQDPTDRATQHLFALDHIEKYNAQEAYVSNYLSANPGDTRDMALLDWGTNGPFASQFVANGQVQFDGTQGSHYEFSDPGDLDPDTNAPFGINEETRFNVTWNSAIEVGENTEVYTFGTFMRLNQRQPFNYRPGFPARYRSGASGAGATFDGSTRDNFGVFDPTSFTYDSYVDSYGVSAANQNEYLLLTIRDNTSNRALAAGEIADADGFIFTDTDGSGTITAGDVAATRANPNGGFFAQNIHPNGFTPFFIEDAQDVGAYLGIRGEFDSGLSYDLWGSVGRNRVDNFLTDTANPSLGAPRGAFDDATQSYGINYGGAPTSFYIGSLVNAERQVGLDFVYPWETDAVESLNIAFGGTYRTDHYYKTAGDANIEKGGVTYNGWDSWRPGPLAGDLNVGSDGFGGFSPGTAFDARRSNWAVYLDIETDVTEDFNFGVAGRYEDFTDFGDNFSWKVAARYQLLEDLLAIRGAASTGFHAPTVAQIANSQVRTGFRADGTQTQSGTFPADSVVGQIFGRQVAGPELARNLSAGFIFTPGDNTNITVDFFQIKLRNLITDSPNFDRDDARFTALFEQIEAAGVPGAETLNRVEFLENGGARKVRGIEAVATHNIDLEDSTLRLSVAYAHVDYQVTEHNLDARDFFNEENNTVFPHKVTARAVWNMDEFTVVGRARYWSTMKRIAGFDTNGNFIGGGAARSAYRVDENPGKIFFDLAITYAVNEQFEVTVGADNILNTYPDRLPSIVEASGLRGRQYLDFGGLDWQGGSYYARLSANF